jgi:hypothetical protein
VRKVIGQLVTVWWDDRTYPYKNVDRYEVNEDAYLARQLTLVSRNEDQRCNLDESNA